MIEGDLDLAQRALGSPAYRDRDNFWLAKYAADVESLLAAHDYYKQLAADASAGAAFLRLAFGDVAARSQAWRDDPMRAWALLYRYVTESHDGLEVLAELEAIRSEAARLQSEVDRLNAALNKDRPPLPVKE